MERRAAAGAVARPELERVRDELATARSVLATIVAEHKRARLDLASAIGVAPFALDSLVLAADVSSTQIAHPLAQKYVATALTMRSEILGSVVAYDNAESEYRSAITTQFPALHIGPGYTWERGLSKLPLAISLSFPSWDLNEAAIQAAEATRCDRGSKLEAAVANVIANIAVADADYRTALDVEMVLQTQTLPVAKRLAGHAENELAAGRIDRAEWAVAQAGLVSTELDYFSAQRKVGEALVALEDALRMPLDGPETLIGVAVFGSKL